MIAIKHKNIEILLILKNQNIKPFWDWLFFYVFTKSLYFEAESMSDFYNKSLSIYEKRD